MSLFDLLSIHDKLSSSHPKLARGRVWCRICRSTQKVNSADCLHRGWPKCCGQTMTIDSPQEWAAPPSGEATPKERG
jgi:hypothetical protein